MRCSCVAISHIFPKRCWVLLEVSPSAYIGMSIVLLTSWSKQYLHDIANCIHAAVGCYVIASSKEAIPSSSCRKTPRGKHFAANCRRVRLLICDTKNKKSATAATGCTISLSNCRLRRLLSEISYSLAFIKAFLLNLISFKTRTALREHITPPLCAFSTNSISFANLVRSPTKFNPFSLSQKTNFPPNFFFFSR